MRADDPGMDILSRTEDSGPIPVADVNSGDLTPANTARRTRSPFLGIAAGRMSIRRQEYPKRTSRPLYETIQLWIVSPPSDEELLTALI